MRYLPASRRPPAWQALTDESEYALLRRVRIDHLVEVRQPLVLVSQVCRSGGTLLSQLFDMHPECHAHPHELHIGYPSSAHWPPFELDRPEEWFSILWERPAYKQLRRGYQKSGRWTRESEGGNDRLFPFLLGPRLQKEIFDAVVASRPVERRRDVLDAYMTSYFNAWLDNHNLYTGPKRVVTAFIPDLANRPPRVEAYFADYPDGTLISIVRDPRSWYVSAREHSKRFANVEKAMKIWTRSASTALDAAERRPGQVVIVTYDQLVLETEATMRRIADAIGIEFRPELLMPTFNGQPIRSNTRKAAPPPGVYAARVRSYEDELPEETVALITERALPLYERAQQAAS